ncbi:MAG: HAD family hydrolase [Fusicatenibacter sp.]|nr:HAD family hydrolase [Lachnospiraceae bacterium]MDY2937868.1 HAD family hydrolase [Fusicatenibacter sp.]
MKALFFDIDGTLLSEITRKVPQSAAEAIKKTEELGNLTFVNTGRTWSQLPGEIRSMPFSGFLCGCGTYIQYEDQVLFHRAIPKERGNEIVRLIKKYDGDMILEGREDIFLQEHMSRFDPLNRTRRYFRNMGLGVEKTAECPDISFDKFVVYTDEKTKREALFDALREDMDLIDRRGGLYEAVPKGYSKAAAIEFVLAHLGISKEDAYVFGDSSNDLSMFQCGAHAIAMGSHDTVLDPYTEFVSKTVEEDGLAYAMKHYGLI